MAIPARMQDRILVLSKLKQGAYGAALTDASLQNGKRFPVNSPVFGQATSKFYTNQAQSMRGTDFVTVRQETERDLQESLAFDGDSWIAAWMAAYAMGSVTSTQLNPTGNPTACQHVIRPMNPGTAGKQLPVTTVYTEAAAAANLQRRLLDCAVKDMSIEFKASAPVALSCNLLGSGQVAAGPLAAPPALSSLNLLMSNNLQLLYGAQGAPADISGQIVAGSPKFTWTWNPDDKNSRGPGGGLYRSRLWVGNNPAASLTFQRFVDDSSSQPNDDWLAGTVQEVQLIVAGAPIGPGPETHLLKIRGLAVVPEAIKLGQAGDKTIYEYTISADHWLQQGTNDVVTITVQNAESSFFV